MDRFRRIALFFFGALIALAAVALLVVNLYVQSKGTQARIEQELSQRFGTPLQIRSLSVTPWGGLTLSGITIPQTSPDAPAHFLEANTFHLHLRILPLFSERLVIKEISLLGLTVVWPQNRDGKWRLPGAHADETSPSPSAQTGPASPTASAPPSAASSAPAARGEQETRSASTPVSPIHTEESARAFVPEIRRINVNDGNFQFLTRHGETVAIFSGVRFRSNIRNSQGLRGDATVKKVSLRNRFFLETLSSPFRYDGNEVELSKMSAHLGGGDVSGTFVIQPQSEDSPFQTTVRFRNVDADQIVTDGGGPPKVIQGKLDGSFDANGETADATAFAGKGEIFLRQGQLQQYSLLVALGQILQIEELTRLELQQAETQFHVSGDVITVDHLILRSPNIRLSAGGTVGFDGKLRLQSQLAINDKVRAQLFQPIRDNFQPADEPGLYAVDFQIGGTVDRPKTNLMEKVVGRDLRDFVNGLLGKGDRKKKKKSQQDQPAAAAPSSPDGSPSPTASP